MLTDLEHAALCFIVRTRRRDGVSPTIKELAAHLGRTTTPARRLMVRLERKGAIRRLPARARAVEPLVTPEPRAFRFDRERGLRPANKEATP